MRPAMTDRQRRHREATGKAMRRMSYRCPACGRGQNRNPIDVSGFGDLLWICVYCEHEWTAGGRAASLRKDEQE